ncbi:MAG TPA: hypothetical protein VNM37_02610 [Candidatus Dormibacteraeota bacterium]|nr:hypothetical protein [Candidatus Dormibacteraeota bacterium]
MNQMMAKGYPADWKVISARIKARSGGQCECEGECGLHRTHPGPRRCVERHGLLGRWMRGLVMLTVAHLNHQPADCRDENLKAMCQRCHLRYDIDHHQRNAAATRRRNKRNLELDLELFEGGLDAPGEKRMMVAGSDRSFTTRGKRNRSADGNF